MTPIEPGPAPASRHLALWQAALLILVAVALFWPGQTTVPPVDRDEARFAQATVQMLESGDFIDIRLQDDPRYLQPAGIYWLQAAAVAGLSEAEARAIWAHRVPSLLGAVAAVALTGWLGARLFGAQVGLLGGLLLASTVLLNVEARLAKIDAMLLASILLALIGLHRAYVVRQERGARLPWGWAVLFWAAVGAGILLKGPINPLVVGLTALTLSIIERRAGWLLALRPAWGVLIAAAIALPWYVAIYIESEGAFFQRSAGQNFLGKLFEGEQGHGFPPGYHLLVAPAVMWPAVLALILAIPWIWRRRRDPAVRFCLAWALPVWILYELVATKLPHYVLPAYPALLLLAAAALLTPVAGEQAGPGGRRWPAWLFGAGWVAWLFVGAGLAAGPLAIALGVDGGAAWPAFA
ncbi:MAG: phospholipid carrier-dependent glycosyltransferase, partial [Alphaproteobacteria bacterium]|nr:phospholipid carrier-dependent glycosyltransferase [Alphaproteobacteria bacterium]